LFWGYSMILIPRQKVYRVVHFGLVAAIGSILIEHFGFTSQALVFVALLFIFREYYLTITETESERPTLIAALEAFITSGDLYFDQAALEQYLGKTKKPERTFSYV